MHVIFLISIKSVERWPASQLVLVKNGKGDGGYVNSEESKEKYVIKFGDFDVFVWFVLGIQCFILYCCIHFIYTFSILFFFLSFCLLDFATGLPHSYQSTTLASFFLFRFSGKSM